MMNEQKTITIYVDTRHAETGINRLSQDLESLTKQIDEASACGKCGWTELEVSSTPKSSPDPPSGPGPGNPLGRCRERARHCQSSGCNWGGVPL